MWLSMKEPLTPIKFCQEPSGQYLEMLAEWGGDPRSVSGSHAINQAGSLAKRGWAPTWDARDARANTSTTAKQTRGNNVRVD